MLFNSIIIITIALNINMIEFNHYSCFFYYSIITIIISIINMIEFNHYSCFSAILSTQWLFLSSFNIAIVDDIITITISYHFYKKNMWNHWFPVVNKPMP